MKMKKTGLILLALLSANSFAGEWTQPLTIKDVSYSFSEGTYSAAQLRVTFDELPTTNICKPTEALAIGDAPAPDGWTQMWMSALLSAQAQNKKVKIYSTQCKGGTIPLIYGVKVLRE